MLEVLSRSEAKARGLTRYRIEGPCKYGHYADRLVCNSNCVQCLNERHAVYKKSPKAKLKAAERTAAWRKKYPGRNQPNVKRWQVENKDRQRELERRAHGKNPERRQASLQRSSKKWRRNNPEKAKVYTREWDRNVRKATPPWVDRSSIREIYAKRPLGHEVDHIIPLNGKTVSGLHVPWNLQYLPAPKNRAKGNRWQPENDPFSSEGFHYKRVSTN